MFQRNLAVTFTIGVLNPYCEVTVGSLTLKTPFIKRTNNPKWNTTMQFLLYDLAEDIIHIKIFDNGFFSPDGLFYIFAFLHRKHSFLLRKYRSCINTFNRYVTMFTCYISYSTNAYIFTNDLSKQWDIYSDTVYY